MNTIPTSIGNVTEHQLLDVLVYQSYAANRDEGMTPERYASMFRNIPVEAYEARYQDELKVEKAFAA